MAYARAYGPKYSTPLRLFPRMTRARGHSSLRVIFEPDVENRLLFLGERILKHQRGYLRLRHNPFEVGRRLDHRSCPRLEVSPEVVRGSLAKRFCFAYVQGPSVAIPKDVDARCVRHARWWRSLEHVRIVPTRYDGIREEV